eukprot:m.149317 g.149317  ORF g.149317 m.149317 type:complete len:99 (+) comp38519_c0_seq50:157-453(+)
MFKTLFAATENFTVLGEGLTTYFFQRMRMCCSISTRNIGRESMRITCEPVSEVIYTGTVKVYYSGNRSMKSTSSSQLPVEISMLAENTSCEIVVEAVN